MRFLFIHEVGECSGEWFMPSLIDTMSKKIAEFEPYYFHGPFKDYTRPGGWRPKRLYNFVYMYLGLPLLLLRFRPEFVLVRTAPPGIQMWGSFLGKLLGIKMICWMMDYHPEIENRYLRKRGLGFVANVIEKIDKLAMRNFIGTVALDEAMAALCRPRVDYNPVIVHPTWGREEITFQPAKSRDSFDGVIRLGYVGNLGAGHDLVAFGNLLQKLKGKINVELYVIGCSANGEQRFNEFALEHRVECRIEGRLPFSKLGTLYERLGIDYGIVLMKDFYAGVMSPSKFSGYLDFGIPLVYIGPELTNADLVASKFGAGISLLNTATDEQYEEAASQMLLIEAKESFHVNAAVAAKYFHSRNANSLEAELINLIEIK